MTDEELVECGEHGRTLPAFLCVHLTQGDGQGFYASTGPADEDDAMETGRPDAWCGACEQRRRAAGGEWTQDSEPEIRLVCTKCWDLLRERNLRGDETW